MRVSLSWVSKLLGVDALPIDNATLLDRLTRQVAEIDECTFVGPAIPDGVVTGRVLTCEQHPEADKLRVTTVDVGTEAPLQIVCGAPNVAADQDVPVATIGSVLPLPDGKPLKIKKGKLRGQLSQGMICAADELGLGNDHSGIMVLAGEPKPGTPLADALPGGDWVLVIDNHAINHRPDLWGHWGWAREIALLCGLQPPEALNTTWQSHGSGLDIALAAKACRSYCGAIITGVANTTALEWMQDHLRAIGAGVHGLLVDVTNYVMHELGQPLHAFDRRLLEAGVIRVEEAADQYSSLTTLDGKEHALHSADLLITDGKKPLALAGVIGGQGSMVQDDTTAIVLESANFAAAGIRATRIRHGVTTDSAIRFEKTLPVEVSVAAANRAIELLLAACPDARVVCQASAGTQADDERTVTFDAERMPALTGIALPAADQIRHLEELGCQVAGTTVTVPWWRRKDINLSIDLVEEIARRHGYDAIQGQVPRLPAAAPAVNRLRQAEHRCRRILSGLGWDEVATYAFQSDAWTDILEIGEAAIRLQHPLAADQAVMRADPLATLLPAAGRNRRFLDSVLLYEIGKCYGTGYGLNDATANERQLVTGVISHANQASTGEITNDPFFAARDAAVALIRGLGYADLAVVASGANQPRLSPGRAAELHLGNTIVGWVSTTPSALVEASSINTGAAWFQIELERLVLHTPTPSPMHFKAVSRFQAVSRDFTFLIGDQHGFASVAEVIHNCSKDLVRSVDLAAEPYRGAGIPAGQRALSFRVVLQADDRTLSEKELSKAHTRIIKTVEHRLGASLRA